MDSDKVIAGALVGVKLGEGAEELGACMLARMHQARPPAEALTSAGLRLALARLQWGTHCVCMKGQTYSLVRIQFISQTES